MTRSPRYTAVAIGLHWAMAALIGYMIWLGWNMEENEARYQLHKSIGITLLLLTVARIIWRVMNPPPKLSEEMPALERKASHAVHMAFYALMVLIPLGGWLLVSVSPFNVPTVLFGQVSWPNLPFTEALRGETLYTVVEFLHSKGAWVIIGLLALHVGGALKHEFIGEEDGVLKRMIPGLLGKTDDPATPARGALTAFGASAALFALVAGAPLVANALQATPPADTGAASELAEITPNWSVDYDSAAITFSGVHDGKDFSGTFESWQAEVAFDPDKLEASAVRVTVDLSSAQTGTKLYDDSLRQAEWFDLKSSPQASVTLDNFQIAPDVSLSPGKTYTADANLTLKGITVIAPLEFALAIDGDEATLNGQTTLSRSALNLGQKSDPGADWVSDEITVTVTGKATRIAP